MTTKHTPGPWWVDGRDQFGTVVGFNRIGDYALICCADPRQEEAFAALIEAAPDLLAALREMLAELDGRIAPHGYIYRDTGGMILARAAIAKAEGRP